jgi:hypothetical protein
MWRMMLLCYIVFLSDYIQPKIKMLTIIQTTDTMNS